MKRALQFNIEYSQIYMSQLQTLNLLNKVNNGEPLFSLLYFENHFLTILYYYLKSSQNLPHTPLTLFSTTNTCYDNSTKPSHIRAQQYLWTLFEEVRI